MEGDGYQASHWRRNNNENNVSGIMNPVLRTGTKRTVTSRDIIVMDTIGYDLSSEGFNLMWQGSNQNNWLAANKSDELIGHLEWHAKDHIAKLVYSNGQAHWVDWWKNNDPNSSWYLTSNRDNDVKQILDNSQVYEAGRSSRRSRSNWQEAYFNEFSWQELNEPIAQSVVIDYAINNSSIIDTKPESIAIKIDERSVLLRHIDNSDIIQESELQLLTNKENKEIADSATDLALLQDWMSETSKLSPETVTL